MFQYSNYMSADQIRAMLNHGLNWLKITGSHNINADAADIIRKSVRSVEAYRAKSDPRQISARDLLLIFAHAAARFAVIPQTPRVPITVFDTYGSPLIRVHSIFSASFIADMSAGSWEIEDGHYVPLRQLPERSERKHRLRTLVQYDLVTEEEACEALGCCPYALVALQIEEPFVDVGAPSVECLAKLDVIASERRGEAA